MRQRLRVFVAASAAALLAIMAVQAELSLLGGGYVRLPGGSLLDWGSFIPAPVVWAIERQPAPEPCHLDIYDPSSHQTMHVDRCDYQ